MGATKKVCVIGAGASGLPAIRHALLYKCDVVCFEGAHAIGGLWRYKPEETDEGTVMKTTVINTSKEMTAYSDFPPSPEAANFMHNSQLLQYFNNYADHFNLRKYIKFNHKVLNVERNEDYAKTGRWKITYKNDQGETKVDVFDGVLCCTGHHTTPYTPAPWPGQDKFSGKIIHSHSYKDHRGYEDKTVVVVGIGNSGGDIAVELSRIAKQVYLVTRRGTWVFNRIFDYGEPFDFVVNTRFAHALRGYVPMQLATWMIEYKLQSRFDHEKYGLKPAHHVFSAHPTVNDELPNRIACGMVRVKPNMKEFKGNSIIFEDGTSVENIDEVILSTGYSFSFPVLEQGKLIPVTENEVELYKYMFPLNLEHNTLAVIGLIQPLGSIMPISEMQARVFLSTLVGESQLPSRKEMREDIACKQKRMAGQFVKSRRHTIQVDFTPYMDELASLIGVELDLKKMFFEDPGLAMKVLFGPNVAYTYRLQGPHKWQGAREAIMSAQERVIKATNMSYRPSFVGNLVESKSRKSAHSSREPDDCPIQILGSDGNVITVPSSILIQAGINIRDSEELTHQQVPV
ncbi:unnamed protein product, partial [Mesorhabditis belari]|uniref:Flavin-containing monooxygenase n=1 Tax=Mesorhabditis belari TaxID=2138241 RepID=A0AAF3FM86_9BILA